jgi:hypothetical protein
MKVFVHKKRAGNNEAALANIESQLSALEEKIQADRDKATQALQVITDEVARLDSVRNRIEQLKTIPY